MSDLKDFRDAIDGIEINRQQKERMYANIITKAENRRRRFSLPSLALRLAPVLSLCLVVVLVGGILLPNIYNGSGKNAEDTQYTIPMANEIDHDDKSGGTVQPASNESARELEIDGVTCFLQIYSAESEIIQATKDLSTTSSSLTISWMAEGKLYVLTSSEAADEQALLKIRDQLIAQLDLPAAD